MGKWCLKDKGTTHEMTKNDNRASMHGYVLCIGNLTSALKIMFQRLKGVIYLITMKLWSMVEVSEIETL